MIKSFPKKYILYQTNGEMTNDEKKWSGRAIAAGL
jgi:hypothetical protein